MHTRNDLIIFYEMPTKNIPTYNESDSQIGITDEQASFWWNTLNEDLLKKFVLKYKHKKWLKEVWGSLPVNVKNDFKKWLITKEAKRGIKISNNNEHRGGKLSGKSHKDGGIRGVIMETGKPIEVENEELITTRGVSQAEDIVTCHGKPEAIVSDLNQKYGGDKISDKQGSCRIKKYIMKKGSKVKTEKMESGKKIKSHIDNRKIERMIIRENELKRADNGMKVENEPLSFDEWLKEENKNPKYPNELPSNGYKMYLENFNDEQASIERQEKNEYILITEPEVYAIMQFVDNLELHEYEKAVPKFIWRGNEICIYKYDQHLVDFLNKHGIHYKVYEHRDELMPYLKSLLPQRMKNKI